MEPCKLIVAANKVAENIYNIIKYVTDGYLCVNIIYTGRCTNIRIQVKVRRLSHTEMIWKNKLIALTRRALKQVCRVLL